MIFKQIKTAIVLIFFSVSLYAAQSTSISGIVSDKQSGERLMFVNIGVEGTLTGTASNADGEFNLRVPENLMQSTLYFSAIGYQNLAIPLSQLNFNEPLNIQLQALTYGIEDVQITADSRVLYRVIRDAARTTGYNYVNQPFAANAIYSSEEFIDNDSVKRRDALVLLTDASGYGLKKNAHKAQNYTFENTHRNFEVNNFTDGTTLMDQLLSLDIMRYGMNITDTLYLNEFDLEELEPESINGTDVWVIAFRHSKPELSRTGMYGATLYQGRLYISKERNVLLKAETQVSSPQMSPYGYSLAVLPENALNNVDFHSIVTYKESPYGYMPDKISIDKNYTNKHNEQVRLVSSLLFIGDINTSPELLNKRQYFERMIPDPDFWSRLGANQ